jgi:hypothetical protein
MKTRLDLTKISTMELMSEISKRNDILIVGNWYFKGHIVAILETLDIKLTKEILNEILQEKNLGIDSAKDDLENFILENFNK